MRITSNHEIYLNGRWQLALEAKEGDTMVNYEDTVCDITKKYIYDMLLGDGSISKTHNAYKFTNTCKEDHKEFLDLRREMLGECFSGMGSRTSGYGTSMLDLCSKSLKSLKEIRELWYPKGKKVVPKDLSWMDDLSLAIWFMEDGSRSHSEKQEDRAVFATNGFTEGECKRLAQRIKDLCGSNLNITVFNNKGWDIRINAGRDSEIDQFWGSIRTYIPKCMQYKLPEKHRGYFKFKPKTGRLLKTKRDAKILSIKKLENDKKTFPHGRCGFDISTETTNYFAKGVLVHNSLGIVYFYDGEWRVNTRGSFTSEQAIKGKDILRKYNINDLDKHATYLVEIIYPENRIIVDYGSLEMLSGLAAFYRGGYELDIYHTPFYLAEKSRFSTISELQSHLETLDHNEEGYVVRLASGERVKFKSAEYLALARVMSNMSPLTFWERMENGIIDREFLEQLPEEFRDESDKICDTLERQYGDLQQATFYEFSSIAVSLGLGENLEEDRKKLGIYLKEEGAIHAPVMFPYLLQNGPESIDKYIMKQIKPVGNVLRDL